MSKHRHHLAKKRRAEGGELGMPGKPRREWDEDLESKPTVYAGDERVPREAEEKKRGGKARKKRKHGGGAKVQHEHIHGRKPHHHAGRMPRKAGGRAGADHHPFSSARAGTFPKGHKPVDVD